MDPIKDQRAKYLGGLYMFNPQMGRETHADLNHDEVIALSRMGRLPILDIINEAEKSIDLSIYCLRDTEVVEEILRAKGRGVRIRIIMEEKIFMHCYSCTRKDNTLERLNRAKIEVRFTPKKYAQLHTKYMIVDNDFVLVMTCNLDEGSFDWHRAFESTRNFLVKTHDQSVLEEVNKIFESDWQDLDYVSTHPRLLLGPDNQREKFIKFFQKAKRTIDIYQQDFTDPQLVSALCDCQKRGVKVRVLMSSHPFDSTVDHNKPFHQMIVDGGGQVAHPQANRNLYIHAKVILIDAEQKHSTAYVGSCNFYAPSLEKNRELGLLVGGENAINKLKHFFNEDWRYADIYS